MDIAIGATVTVRTISNLVRKFFPRRTTLVCRHPNDGPYLSDCLRNGEPYDFSSEEEEWQPEVFAKILELDIPDFPIGIDLGVAPDIVGDQATYIRFSRYLHQRLGCQTTCDGTGYGRHDSPYLSIVWSGGAPYLANDDETDREPPKPYKILHRIPLHSLPPLDF